MDLPAVLLCQASPQQCSASWPANRLAAGHFRCLRRTDNTEPAIALAYSFPIGAGKTADADPCIQRLSAFSVLPRTRSDDRHPLAELRPTVSPPLQNTQATETKPFMTQ